MLFIVVASYIGLCAALYLLQREFLYRPVIGALGTPAEHGLEDFSEANATADGLSLLVWQRPADEGMPTVVLFHGNGGNVAYRSNLLRALGSTGFGVVALEYRGYGPNKGAPSEDGLYRDGRAALAFARDAGVPESRVILYGESLGSGVAVQMATECGCALLALQSPYTAMTDVVQWHVPFVPADMLLTDRYASIDKLAAVEEPVMIVHGEADNVVPAGQGRALFAAVRGTKDALWLSDRGHNDLPAAGIASKLAEFAAANRLIGNR